VSEVSATKKKPRTVTLEGAMNRQVELQLTRGSRGIRRKMSVKIYWEGEIRIWGLNHSRIKGTAGTKGKARVTFTFLLIRGKQVQVLETNTERRGSPRRKQGDGKTSGPAKRLVFPSRLSPSQKKGVLNLAQRRVEKGGVGNGGAAANIEHERVRINREHRTELVSKKPKKRGPRAKRGEYKD